MQENQGVQPVLTQPAWADGEQQQEEKDMLSMPVVEHLEELRSRILKALWGLVAAFGLSLGLASQLWDIISDPATAALKHLGVNPPLTRHH